jgi:hypothetical protein
VIVEIELSQHEIAQLLNWNVVQKIAANGKPAYIKMKPPLSEEERAQMEIGSMVQRAFIIARK